MQCDASLSLIGFCLRDSAVFTTAHAKGINIDCFDDSDQAAIWTALQQAEQEERPMDVTSLAMANPKLAEPLMRIRAGAPISQSPDVFIDELLIERWRRGAMLALRNASAALVGRKTLEPIDKAKAALLEALNFALMHPTSTATGPKKIADVLAAEMEQIERDRETGRADGIPTGIQIVDRITSGGLKRGSVNVFAARTGVGKTTLALNMARNIATAGFPVCYFTVEMPAGQLARKLLSSVGEVRGSRVMSGKLEPIECDRLVDAAAKLQSAPLWIDDTFMARFENFETACRRLKRQHGLDVVVIDYIQQLGMEGRFFSKQQLVTEVSHRVKQLALELELVVISLAQFNRDAEKLEGEPSIWHVKDSGAIEQDADLGVCLYRDADETFWLKFDKNRWGPDRAKYPIEADLAFNIFRDMNVNMPEIL